MLALLAVVNVIKKFAFSRKNKSQGSVKDLLTSCYQSKHKHGYTD